MADIGFDGKVAIITGAGGGLGRCHALELARRGARIVVNDLGGSVSGEGGSAGPAQQVADEIVALGGEAVADTNSVATPEGGEAIVTTALDAFGTVDIVINNAGILRDKSFHNMTPELLNPVLDVHLKGAFYVTQPAWKVMREKNYGRVVNTASNAGILGNFGQTNYGAAKLGLVGFMNSLGIEGAKYNIKVNTIAPVAATRLTEDIMPPEIFQKLNPEYVTPVVLFLCSEQCQDSRKIICTGAGLVQRAMIVVNDGAFLGKEPSTPEAVADKWAQILEPKNLRELDNVMAQSLEIMKFYG